jgi:hypothetical protein
MGASTPFQSREAAQAFFRTAQAELDMTDEELVYLFELNSEELARASAGDTTVWEARLNQEFSERFHARVEAKAASRARQAQAGRDRADSLRRAHALMAEAGVPDGMSVGDALQAGLLTMEQVNQAIHAAD